MTRSIFTRFAPVAAAGLAVVLFAGVAGAAQPKDKQAEKAINDAMNTDYLATDFDKATKKLRAAIDACGASGCTPALKAKLYMSLGTVLAGGLKQLQDAQDAFVDGLKLDSSARPDPDLTSSEITFAYENARKELKLGGGSGSSSSGTSGSSSSDSADIKPTTPSEQKVRTPVPVYIEVSEALNAKAKKAVVSYLGPSESDYRSLVMKKLGERGYGMNIPCTDVATEGTVKYYITVTDESGAILGSVGSRSDPLTTAIKKAIAGDPPHWPGFAAPETCSKEDTSSPQQCIDDNECSAGLRCDEGKCVPKPEGPETPKDSRLLNWMTLSIVPDASLFSGESVCSLNVQDRDHYVCLRSDESRYDGTPTAGLGNNINTGFLFSSLRATLGYDRVFIDALTVGVRVGAAILAPTSDAVSFQRIHAEARAAYYFGTKPFESKGARPFVLVSGGFAQYNSKIDVEVLEDGKACGAADPDNIADPCTKPTGAGTTPEPRTQKLAVYKQAGLGFVSVGGGLSYAPVSRVAINVGVRVSLTLPVVTTVFSPEAGVSVGF